MQTLNEIRDYLDASLRKALASSVPLVDQPGPGVARVRVAITAASVDTGLKPYQLLPAAMVFTAAKAATGQAIHDANLAVETDITDSVSGDPLGKAVCDGKGIEVKGDEKLTLSRAKPQIDQWAKSVQEYFSAKLKAK